MKKNKETKKLKEGEEVIFSDGKTLMEKVIVESIDKKGGFAVLSNKAKAQAKANSTIKLSVDSIFKNLNEIGRASCRERV